MKLSHPVDLDLKPSLYAALLDVAASDPSKRAQLFDLRSLSDVYLAPWALVSTVPTLATPKAVAQEETAVKIVPIERAQDRRRMICF